MKEPIGLSDGNDGIHENKKNYESAHPQKSNANIPVGFLSIFVKIQFKGVSTWKYNLQARSNHTLPSGVKKAHSGGLGSLVTKKKKDCY